jgi:CRP-like cAMP-binding protein
VPWLRGGTPGFVASIALALEPELYAPKETILGNELRVLVRGVAVKDACIYTRGCVWGIDIILQSKRLKRSGVARALTYAQIFTLNQSRLEELLDHYPSERTRLRVSAIWMALRRGFIQYSRDMVAARDHISDIADQAEARVSIYDVAFCCVVICEASSYLHPVLHSRQRRRWHRSRRDNSLTWH